MFPVRSIRIVSDRRLVCFKIPEPLPQTPGMTEVDNSVSVDTVLIVGDSNLASKSDLTPAGASTDLRVILWHKTI